MEAEGETKRKERLVQRFIEFRLKKEGRKHVPLVSHLDTDASQLLYIISKVYMGLLIENAVEDVIKNNEPCIRPKNLSAAYQKVSSLLRMDAPTKEHELFDF